MNDKDCVTDIGYETPSSRRLFKNDHECFYDSLQNLNYSEVDPISKTNPMFSKIQPMSNLGDIGNKNNENSEDSVIIGELKPTPETQRFLDLLDLASGKKPASGYSVLKDRIYCLTKRSTRNRFQSNHGSHFGGLGVKNVVTKVESKYKVPKKDTSAEKYSRTYDTKIHQPSRVVTPITTKHQTNKIPSISHHINVFEAQNDEKKVSKASRFSLKSAALTLIQKMKKARGNSPFAMDKNSREAFQDQLFLMQSSILGEYLHSPDVPKIPNFYKRGTLVITGSRGMKYDFNDQELSFDEILKAFQLTENNLANVRENLSNPETQSSSRFKRLIQKHFKGDLKTTKSAAELRLSNSAAAKSSKNDNSSLNIVNDQPVLKKTTDIFSLPKLFDSAAESITHFKVTSPEKDERQSSINTNDKPSEYSLKEIFISPHSIPYEKQSSFILSSGVIDSKYRKNDTFLSTHEIELPFVTALKTNTNTTITSSYLSTAKIFPYIQPTMPTQTTEAYDSRNSETFVSKANFNFQCPRPNHRQRYTKAYQLKSNQSRKDSLLYAVDKQVSVAALDVVTNSSSSQMKNTYNKEIANDLFGFDFNDTGNYLISRNVKHFKRNNSIIADPFESYFSSEDKFDLKSKNIPKKSLLICDELDSYKKKDSVIKKNNTNVNTLPVDRESKFYYDTLSKKKTCKKADSRESFLEESWNHTQSSSQLREKQSFENESEKKLIYKSNFNESLKKINSINSEVNQRNRLTFNLNNLNGSSNSSTNFEKCNTKYNSKTNFNPNCELNKLSSQVNKSRELFNDKNISEELLDVDKMSEELLLPEYNSGDRFYSGFSSNEYLSHDITDEESVDLDNYSKNMLDPGIKSNYLTDQEVKLNESLDYKIAYNENENLQHGSKEILNYEKGYRDNGRLQNNFKSKHNLENKSTENINLESSVNNILRHKTRLNVDFESSLKKTLNQNNRSKENTDLKSLNLERGCIEKFDLNRGFKDILNQEKRSKNVACSESDCEECFHIEKKSNENIFQENYSKEILNQNDFSNELLNQENYSHEIFCQENCLTGIVNQEKCSKEILNKENNSKKILNKEICCKNIIDQGIRLDKKINLDNSFKEDMNIKTNIVKTGEQVIIDSRQALRANITDKYNSEALFSQNKNISNNINSDCVTLFNYENISQLSNEENINADNHEYSNHLHIKEQLLDFYMQNENFRKQTNQIDSPMYSEDINFKNSSVCSLNNGAILKQLERDKNTLSLALNIDQTSVDSANVCAVDNTEQTDKQTRFSNSTLISDESTIYTIEGKEKENNHFQTSDSCYLSSVQSDIKNIPKTKENLKKEGTVNSVCELDVSPHISGKTDDQAIITQNKVKKLLSDVYSLLNDASKSEEVYDKNEEIKIRNRSPLISSRLQSLRNSNPYIKDFLTPNSIFKTNFVNKNEIQDKPLMRPRSQAITKDELSKKSFDESEKRKSLPLYNPSKVKSNEHVNEVEEEKKSDDLGENINLKQDFVDRNSLEKVITCEEISFLSKESYGPSDKNDNVMLNQQVPKILDWNAHQENDIQQLNSFKLKKDQLKKENGPSLSNKPSKPKSNALLPFQGGLLQSKANDYLRAVQKSQGKDVQSGMKLLLKRKKQDEPIGVATSQEMEMILPSVQERRKLFGNSAYRNNKSDTGSFKTDVEDQCEQENRNQNIRINHDCQQTVNVSNKIPTLDVDMNNINLSFDKEEPQHNQLRMSDDVTPSVESDSLGLGANNSRIYSQRNKDLIIAVSRNDARRVKILLKQGADSNAKYKVSSVNTVLHKAVSRGYHNVVKELVCGGANVKAKTDLGNSALHLAAKDGHINIVQHLIEYGADVNVTTSYGVSPLQYSLAMGHLTISNIFLRHHADTNIPNIIGETACDLAHKLGYKQSLTQSSFKNCDSIPLNVQLIKGIEDKCPITVEKCLQNSANPNTVVPLALHWPANATVLHRAAYKGDDVSIRLLLNARSSVNVRDIVHNTPLHAAAQKGDVRVIGFLINSGSDLEARTQKGMTPLHRAASKGNDLAVKQLLMFNADRMAQDESGRTPADWACKRGFNNLALKLRERRFSSTLPKGETQRRRSRRSQEII